MIKKIIVVLTTCFLLTITAFSEKIEANEVLPPPEILPAGPVTFCSGGWLVVNGTSNNTSYQWQLGTNNIPNSNNDSLYVTSSGTYTCVITIGNNSNTLNDVVVTVNSISLSASSVSICNGSSVTLTASGSTNGTYTWLTPSTGTGSSLSLTPTNNTIYSVSGIINGCLDTATISVTVKPKPSASFNYSPNNGCPRRRRKLEFSSTSQSNGSGNLTYSWDFGDPNSGSNNTSNDNNPDHSFVGTGFSNAGTFNVTLTVTGSNGCSSSVTQIINIGSYPDATLTDAYNFPEFAICDSNILTVVNASSTIATNTNYQILWGDGTSTSVATMDSLTHAYLTTGNQNLVFIVSSGGCKDSTDYSVYIGSNPGIGLSTSGSTTLLCLPSTKTFFIDTTRTRNNPLGTVYTVVYNDGSPDQIFTHPPPASFNHTFTTTSCGATGGTFANTFFVTVYASNPCGTTQAKVEPITTILPPTADFTIVPDTIVCVNTTVSFTNSSQNGNVVIQSGSGPTATFSCDPSSSPFWSISALTGVNGSWTTSGNYGFLPNNPGDQTVSASFSQTGTYAIKLTIRNSANSPASCRSDDTTKTICVQKPPSPYFKMSPKIGCNSLLINITDSSYDLPTCGASTRTWTVTKILNQCNPDSLSNYVFTGGTGVTSINPQILFYNEGQYQIKLSLTNKCGTFSYYDTVIVKRKPQVTLSASPLVICAGESITPTISALACSGTISNYNWGFPGGTPSSYQSASNPNPGTVTYNNPGTYIIYDTVKNECGVNVDQISITVNPTPTINAVSNITKCAGQPSGAINFTGNQALATYTWSNSNTAIGLASSGTGNIPSFVLVNNTGAAITSTITVTPTLNNCTGNPISFTITVNPNPSVTVNNASICSGTAATLTASGADTYSWSPATGLSATTGATVSANPASGVNYTVVGTITATGCTASAVAAVTVNTAAVISGVKTDPTICATANGSILISGLSPNTTYTLNYSAGGTAQTPITFTTGNGVTTYTLANLQAAVYSGITVTANGCTSNALSFSLSDPNPPATPSAASNSALCSGATLNLTASGSVAGATYNWSGPNGFSSTQQNPSITNTSTAASGVYNVTVTVNGCTSPAGTTTVVIEQTPPTPVAGSNTPVCTGTALTLTASTSSTMPVSWSWTGPNSYISNNQNPQVSASATNALAGTYNVTATANYAASNVSCPATASTIVVVNATPAISSSSSSNPTNCASGTGTIVLNGLNANQLYEVHYTGPSGPITINLTSNATGSIIIPTLPAGTYNNVYVVLNNCSSAAVGPFNLSDPNPPATPAVVAVNPICSGGTINLSASTTSLGTATWNWLGPNGFSSNQQNPSISNTDVSATGTYSVTVTINGCTSPAGSVDAVVEQTPATPVVGSNTPVCTGTALTLNASTTSTMPVSWSWTGPNSFSSNNQNPQVSSSATTAMAGTYNVTATANYAASNLSCPATASTNVVVNATPAINNATSNNPTDCATATGTIILNGLNASQQYEVHYTGPTGPVTINLSTNSTGSITIPTLPAGNYSNVYVVLNNCPSAAVGPFNLVDPTPPPTPSATGTSNLCDGESLQLNASTSAPGTATWSWSGPNGFISTLANPVIDPAGVNATGTYNVTVTINSCTSLPGSFTATVHPRPAAPVVTSPVIYCQYATPSALTATALAGHTLNWYTTATGGTASATAPTPSTSTTGTVSYYVSQTSPNNCEGIRAQIDVTVNPTPVITNQTTTICSGASFSLQPTGTGVNATTVYSWAAPVVTGGLTGGVAGTDAASITGSLSNPTDFIQTATYTIIPKTGNCPGNSFILTVTVNPAPRVSFSIGDQTICSGSTTNAVQLTSLTPNVNIPWTTTVPAGIIGVTTSGNNTIPAQTLINQTAAPLTVSYNAVAVNSGSFSCPGDTTRYFITVNPKPFLHDTSLVICSGSGLSLSPVNAAPYNIVPAGTTYTWQVSNNSNLNGQSDTSSASTLFTQSPIFNSTNTSQTITYTVTPTSGAAGSCVGLPFTITVTVHPAPAFPTMVTTICSGQTFDTIPVNNPPFLVPAGTTYTWTIPTMPSGNGGQTSGGQAQNNQTHIYGTLNNSAFEPLNVVYTVTPSSGNTSGNACAGAPFNFIVTVNPLASISNNPLNQSVCNNNSTLPVNWTSFTAGSTYSWTIVSSGNVTGYLPAGGGPTLGTMTLTNNGIAQDSVVYAVSSTASACAGPATNYTIYVNPDAQASFTVPYDTACWPYAIVINNNSPQSPGNINIPNGSYNWYSVDPSGVSTLIGTGTNFPGYTISGPSDSITIKMVAISAFGCLNDSFSHTFYTKPQPTAAFLMSNHDSCGPLTVSFTNQTNLTDTFQYQWTFGNGQTSTSPYPAPVTYLSSPVFYDTTYYITMMAYNECDTSIYTDSVIVRADPKALFSVSSTSGCSPFTIQIINSSLGNSYEYYWDFGDGNLDTTYANGSFSHTYYTSVVDTFHLMLIAQNQCGRDTQIINIRVAPNIIVPGITIDATELYGCVAHDVNFLNSTTGATSFTWDFGDLTPPVTTSIFQQVVPHTYNTAGTFNVTVNMTNGCSDTVVYKQVIVYPQPVAAFTTDQSLYCLGDTTHVLNTSQQATSYVWSWGNGQTNNGFEPPYVYTAPGTYTIQLQAQVTAPTGVVCFDTVSHPITVLSKPDSTLITNINLANCSPYVMTASTPGVINETVTWYVYDTTVVGYPIVLNGPTLQYTFNNAGTYTVEMVVENAAGCKDSATRTFTVYQKPTAGFTPLNLSTCSLDTIVNYTNTTTANNYTPLTYQWYVDGIRTATTGNFNYHYITSPAGVLPRIFQTKLVATNSVGCADSITGLLQVNPTAKSIFSLNNPTACIPFVADITNNSTYATNYQWYLNGVLVSTAAAPQINITQANTNYTLTLVVSNQYACRADTSSYNFRSRVMPKAAFQLNNNLGCTGQLSVVTTNTSTNANSYQWEWGDGSAVSTLFNPTHLYTNVGTYQLLLTASDGQCTDTVSQYVVVANKPIANFYADQVIACDTATIHLINLTSNADSYQWYISNGYTTTDPSPTVVLPPSNTLYTVTLVAYNAAGCKDSLIKANYIRSIIPPPADFQIDPGPVQTIPNYSFSFINLVPDDPKYSYTWSLGDGTYANTRDVLDHQYADTGSYNVQLIVLDNTTGCTDTITKVARIEGYPGYLYVPNAFYPNSQEVRFRSFKPLGKGLAEYEMQIFDSWGKLLYSTTKLDWAGSPVEGWDGTFKGKQMPQDAYAWRIRAKFRNGREWSGMQYNNNENGAPGHTFGTLTLFR